MKKKILAAVMAATMVFSLVACGSSDAGSSAATGSANAATESASAGTTSSSSSGDGKELATYEGKIDIDTNDGGYVKFDFNGKRYIYYNCFVESIADID